MKILTVIGARPQFVKCALLSKEIRKHHEEVLVHTGQHYDTMMSDAFFKDLEIPEPTVNLKIHDAPPGIQTGMMMMKLGPVMKEMAPNLVLVYGDTNSTLAGALVASGLNIPVAHVEAGCRSFDKTMPEEVNRVVTDYISELHFCPTDHCMSNLYNEGIRGADLTGDVMIDMVTTYQSKFECKPRICDDDYILLTLHRPINVDQKDTLISILKSIGEISTKVIFPAHPRTVKMMMVFRIHPPPNVQVIDPLGYLDMLGAINSAVAVITDSGGVQKEAYTLGIPCTTVRQSTEWPETLEGDWNVLSTPTMVGQNVMRQRPTRPRPRVFGLGMAVQRIMDELEEWYGTDRTTN